MADSPRSDERLEVVERQLGVHPELRCVSLAQRRNFVARVAPLCLYPGEPDATIHAGGVVIRAQPVKGPKPRQHHAGVYTAGGDVVPDSRVVRGVERDCIVGEVPGRDVSPTRHVDEDVVYGGFVFSHFGHVLLESMARVWGARLARGEVPIVLQSRDGRLSPVARRLFELAGVAGSVRMVTEHTSFRSVTVPAPAFQIRHHAHATFKRQFLSMTDRALGAESLPVSDQPLYLSRSALSPTQRAMCGEAKLEAELERQGFRIAHPETLGLEEQIRLVNTHRVVVGPLGSAFHMLLFSRIVNDVVVLTSGSPNATYVLCDALNGSRSHYLNVCTRPKVFEHPGLKWWEYPEMLDLEDALAELDALGLVTRPRIKDPESQTGLLPEYRRRFLWKAVADARRRRDASLLERADALVREEFSGDAPLMEHLCQTRMALAG